MLFHGCYQNDGGMLTIADDEEIREAALDGLRKALDDRITELIQAAHKEASELGIDPPFPAS